MSSTTTTTNSIRVALQIECELKDGGNQSVCRIESFSGILKTKEDKT
ncbi:unnamed protein product [Chironomus riparius]|uniref:Uncharacterized protein n=1 Tax=Chironomus riparius TaxID=315576 RepID=A0A9N9RZK3_9DIPT|nr:unnamed protein product [Chironomus riparius]